MRACRCSSVSRFMWRGLRSSRGIWSMRPADTFRLARRGAVSEALAEIRDDDPVTLEEACKLFFRGRLTKSALRTEHRKGNLEFIRIGNKDFVTHNGVKRMMEKCRKSESHQGSTSDRTPEGRSGSSGMAKPISAQDALRIKLKKRAENFTTTSRPNTSPSAEVVRLK